MSVDKIQWTKDILRRAVKTKQSILLIGSEGRSLIWQIVEEMDVDWNADWSTKTFSEIRTLLDAFSGGFLVIDSKEDIPSHLMDRFALVMEI